MRVGGKKGFTLLEIVVALSILSISFVALLSAQTRAMIVSANAMELTGAVTLAREEMERYHIKPLPDPGVSEPKKRDDYPEFTWVTEIRETPVNRAFEVTIRVFEAGGKDKPEVVNLKSYITK